MSHKRIVTGFIPARYGSTRLPGKALANICGLPMVVRVMQGASGAKTLDRLTALTDDIRILEAITNHGGEAVLTPVSCKNGTERIGYVLDEIPCSIAVNIQGDEPLITGEIIDKAVKPLLEDESIDIATLACPIDSIQETNNPSAVKVVCDIEGFALYFSRSPIPYRDLKNNEVSMETELPLGLKHIGLYVYRSQVVKAIASAAPTPLELAEKLEQLRMLEMGFKIKVVVIQDELIGVDTAGDLEKIREIFRQKLI